MIEADRIDYTHYAELHSVNGARAALSRLLKDQLPGSILDIGCGIGTWMRAALDLGVKDVFGVDGIDLRPDQLHVPKKLITVADVRSDISLGRKYELALCLEVAEHLEAIYARALINSLALHSEQILFSAAAPGQGGQHHVNCKWPAYWQGLFNEKGYVCDDQPRWLLWNESAIEPWYRQNVFIAKFNPEEAGTESRIRPVIHPEMLDSFAHNFFQSHCARMEDGCMTLGWYLGIPKRAIVAKLSRKIRGLGFR